MGIDVRRGHEIDEAVQQLCSSCAHTQRDGDADERA